jgi:hypothetical protein
MQSMCFLATIAHVGMESEDSPVRVVRPAVVAAAARLGKALAGCSTMLGLYTRAPPVGWVAQVLASSSAQKDLPWPSTRSGLQAGKQAGRQWKTCDDCLNKACNQVGYITATIVRSSLLTDEIYTWEVALPGCNHKGSSA